MYAISQVTLFATRDHTRARRGASSPTRRGRSTSRWQAVLTAAAFVLSSLFGLVHEATTTHVRCAQHGELIDRDAPPAHAALAVPSVSSTNADDPASVSCVSDLPGVAMHGHEHCTLISAMRESRVVPRPPSIAPALVAIRNLAAAVPRTTAAPGRVLYRTAPKTSPPA